LLFNPGPTIEAASLIIKKAVPFWPIFTRATKKFQITNPKWFDKPFDRLTVLSRVEGLTTLSQAEGQITKTEIQNSI
jgi:hypothetical protein